MCCSLADAQASVPRPLHYRFSLVFRRRSGSRSPGLSAKFRPGLRTVQLEFFQKKAGCLFCPFPYQFGSPAARRSRVSVLHFVARERHGSFLIGPVPIRKRAAFNVKVKGMIRLIDRVGAKVRNGALYRRLIFIRRAFKTVVAREFSTRVA